MLPGERIKDDNSQQYRNIDNHLELNKKLYSRLNNEFARTWEVMVEREKTSMHPFGAWNGERN